MFKRVSFQTHVDVKRSVPEEEPRQEADPLGFFPEAGRGQMVSVCSWWENPHDRNSAEEVDVHDVHVVSPAEVCVCVCVYKSPEVVEEA